MSNVRRAARACRGAAWFAIPEGRAREAIVLIRLLYLAPVLLLFAVAGGLVQRHTAQQQWLASAYAAAEDAANAGDIVAAREGFMAIVGYRDAAEQAREIETRLEPLEAGYLDGLQAIERGDYAAAVDLLAPVAEQAPGLRDTVTRLEDARRLLAAELRRDVDAAETVRDWPAAEQTLRKLVALDASDDGSRLGWVCCNASMARSYSATTARSGWWRRMGASLASSPMRYTSSGRFGVRIARRSHSWRLILRTRWATSPSTASPSTDQHLSAWSTASRHTPRHHGVLTAPGSPIRASLGMTRSTSRERSVSASSTSRRGKETDLTGADVPAGLQSVVVSRRLSDRLHRQAPGTGRTPSTRSWRCHGRQSWAIWDDGFENVTNGAVRDVWSVSWSPRGDELLLYSLFGQTWYEPPSTSIRVLNRATGEIDQLAGLEERPTMPVWSPDGTRFAFTAKETSIVVANSSGNHP